VTKASDAELGVPGILTRPRALHALVRRALSAQPAPSPAVPEGLRRAAVLLPLVHARGGAALLLTKRSDAVETHKGQISFPGGVLEEGESPREAALRETSEEIGVGPGDVEVLGALGDEVTVVSGFLVTAIVGTFPYPYPLRPSPQEVREILEVPLRALLDPRTFRREVWVREERRVPVYFYTVGSDVIWGATARIIAKFLETVFGVSPQPGTEAEGG
jgi:8-oxo-dGTP pyrophosphatase MutT (NUDIX family)